ncbi:MAG: SPASM domain-containing protein [Flavobacteriales bacterium]|jgi:radical SAM protein with 4Fe4S-binding SPASM domain|nr:SPASM domain-containing protein [Flavobacteriales bacterium]MDP4716302.1 SPASM domain-containing protein [Flavobacteriales bacterium]MDP4731196.1 SPASM domain-containing protein [Flavobacteriales bacterium]MDP4818233.1 SPASM domain-containing protein [Flavobacteriales bacterium]
MKEFLRFIQKTITAKRLTNALLVYIGFYFSRFFKSAKPWGMPISLSIEPTTACNLGCPECPSGLKQFSRDTGNLKAENFNRWLDQLSPTLSYLNFYFQGEPFIHNDILQFISKASQAGIYTSTSTNAHFITEKKAQEIVQSGLDRILISIDGTTQEVYEQYRVHGSLQKVLDGTKHLVEARKNLNSRTPHIIFQFLVVRPNEHQIEEAKQLANEYKVDEIRFKTAQVYNYENGNPLIPTIEKYSRYKRLSNGKFIVKSSLDNHCWRMWSGAVVTWDGKVVPCCFDKDATHEMGNLSKEDFKSIWKGKAYAMFRKQLLKGRKEIDICKNCSEGTKVWA